MSKATNDAEVVLRRLVRLSPLLVFTGPTLFDVCRFLPLPISTRERKTGGRASCFEEREYQTAQSRGPLRRLDTQTETVSRFLVRLACNFSSGAGSCRYVRNMCSPGSFAYPWSRPTAEFGLFAAHLKLRIAEAAVEHAWK